MGKRTKDSLARELADLVIQSSEAEEELYYLYRNNYSEADIAQELQDKGVEIDPELYEKDENG